MLKVFAATARTQGRRANDFTCTEGPELVDLAMTCDSDRGTPDGHCGCARAFSGLDSRRATTTAEIVERDLTPEQYRDAFRRSLAEAGFGDDAEARREAEEAAEEMRNIADQWPVGTVVERRGNAIQVRHLPTPENS